MTECPSVGSLVEVEIDRVATQYRESPHLLGMMRAYLAQVEEAIRATCAIPSFFDIDSAIGDQLTLLGKRLGFPRCHCVCTIAPVFGFDCDGGYGGPYELVGFCEGGTWLACQDTGTSTICIDDDEIYRKLLKARRYQARGLYDIASLQAAADEIWGVPAYTEYLPQEMIGFTLSGSQPTLIAERRTSVHSLGGGRVAVSPNRVLTPYELTILPIAFRALPFAPGIRPLVALVDDVSAPTFGFGAGWGGFCQSSVWLCPQEIDIYTCS